MGEDGPAARPEGVAVDAARDTVRIRLDLGYDGSDFHGWADQPGLRTVEGELAAVLATVVRVPVRLSVAGRTDAGVHARHQVVHVDLPRAAWVGAPGHSDVPRDAGSALVRRLNGLLARRFAERGQGRGVVVARGTCDVVVHTATRVTADFDARFSAVGRRYSYRLCAGTRGRDPVRRHDVAWLDAAALDIPAMRRAAEPLLGEHDFLSFCRPRPGATTIRTLAGLSVVSEQQDAGVGGEQGVVVVRVQADAFCHSMVRSIVGALVEVGLGRRPASWPTGLLAARSRASAAPIAPAHGLTLEGVDYPPPSLWAVRAAEARHRRDEAQG